MEKLPKISIITPSFNQGQYIEQTIDSVLSQNYPNLEYIIIDGGSTDNTVEIIKKYEKHLKYWVSEPDRGQSHAINKGLAKATGDIFNWINSDDYLEQRALHEVGQYFMENPELKLLCGYGRIFESETGETKMQHRTKIYKTVAKTLIQEELNQQGMFYSLPLIKSLGGINESLNYVMDLELWFRFLLAYGIKDINYTDKVLGYFRLHTQSKTTAFDELFREEAKQVFGYIFEQAKLPQAIIAAYQTAKNNYKPQNWQFNFLNSTEILNEISNRYLFDFYKNHQTKAAQIAYIQQIKTGSIKLNKAYMSLFYRLFISKKEYGK